MKKQIYFMHVPKVAGTSVNSVFSNYFGEDEVVLHCENKKCDLQSYSFVSGHVAWPTFRAIIDGADAYKFTIMRDPIDHLLSHLRWVWRLSLPEFQSDYLRHDEDIRAIVDSLSEVDLRSISDIESFLESTSGHARNLFINGQSRYFMRSEYHGSIFGQRAFRDALSNFRDFDIVGTLDRLQDCLNVVSQENGISLGDLSKLNSNPVALDLDVSFGDRDRLCNFVPIDCALYELARSQV